MTFALLSKAHNPASTVQSTLKELVSEGLVKSRADAVEVLTLYGIMLANKECIEAGRPIGIQIKTRRSVQTTIALHSALELVQLMRKSAEDHAAFLSSMRRK